MGRAELPGNLPPGELHRPLENQLGNFGQAIADLHHRQPAGQIGHRHSEDGRALEVTQGFHLVLGLAVLHMAHAQLQLLNQTCAPGQVRQQALIDELIQQQRLGRNLAREKLAMPAKLHQPLAGSPILAEERKVGRALPDGLDDSQNAAHHRQLRARA